MALARWQATITDGAGNIVPNAQVEVRHEIAGSPLARLYSDRQGTVPASNPIAADANGYVFFHVTGGAYRITATKGTFSREWRYVGIGRNSESDLAGLRPQGAWAADLSYSGSDYIRHKGRTFVSLVDENVGHAPPDAPADNAFWMWVPLGENAELAIEAREAAEAQAGHAQEWAQSANPISVAAGGDGATDRSSKWHADRSLTAQQLAEDARDLAQDWASNAVDASGLLPRYTTIDALLADTGIGYAGSAPTYPVGAGIVVWGGSFRYEVAPPEAVDHHLVTVSGVKLYVLPDAGGYNVKAFGAKGDGSTNDTDALFLASSAINALGGGQLTVPPGTYIVGKQTFAGAFGKDYAYEQSDIIVIENCARPVRVCGYGAVLKLDGGLRYGSFDPVTGEPHSPTLPFTNRDYRARVGYMIRAVGNASIEIVGFELDGNNANLTLGGQWGDTGRQLQAHGVYVQSNSLCLVRDVYTHHHGLDGIQVTYPGLTDASRNTPHTLINVVSEYNGRQGFSWVGGKGLTAIGCKFNHNGRGAFSSSPSAGVDIEAQSSVCRKGLFLNCEMVDNKGVGMVADSGDSADVTFRRCTFTGTDNYAIWPQKPRLVFDECTIVGAFVNSYTSSTKPGDATQYVRCLFTDEVAFAPVVYSTGNMSASSSHTNVRYDQCTFVTSRSRPGRFDGAFLDDCAFHIRAGTELVANRDWVLNVSGATLKGCRFYDEVVSNQPSDAFYILLSSNTRFNGKNELISASGKIKWSSWSPGAGGFVGLRGNSHPEEFFSMAALPLHASGFSSLRGGYRRLMMDAAAPTTGEYQRGDIIFNQSPSPGGYIGWVCTTAGTAGSTAVFKRFGLIEA